MANSLFELVKRVREELPEGFEIIIRMQDGDAWVELETPSASIRYHGDLEEKIQEALFDALEEVTSK